MECIYHVAYGATYLHITSLNKSKSFLLQDGSEASPLSKELVNRKYDSVSARLPDPVSAHPAAADARSRGHFRYSRKPVKSLEIYIRWNDVDGTAGVVLRTLHLTRVKRRKGIVVKMELLTDKNTIWSRLKGDKDN